MYIGLASTVVVATAVVVVVDADSPGACFKAAKPFDNAFSQFAFETLMPSLMVGNLQRKRRKRTKNECERQSNNNIKQTTTNHLLASPPVYVAPHRLFHPVPSRNETIHHGIHEKSGCSCIHPRALGWDRCLQKTNHSSQIEQPWTDDSTS